jgi:copper chaperone CopZ
MEIGTIKIADIPNQQAADTITQALTAVNGVISARVSLAGKRASVNFEADKTSIDDLKQVVVNNGFELALAHGEGGHCCGGCGG